MTLVTDYEPNDQPPDEPRAEALGGAAPSHTARLKQMLAEAQQHAREEVAKVADPQARALFEVTAEVLGGLLKAYGDYETKSEPAWQPRSAA